MKPVLDYMDALNHELISHMSPTSTTDINHVVPLHVLQKDELFLYIHQSNSTYVHCFLMMFSTCMCSCEWMLLLGDFWS